MSRSPHRLLGGPADCWRLVLLGGILRALDADAEVVPEPIVRLPRTGRWETGLARLRPALDDALGATAFAVAWRWARAEADRNAWPGATLVARKAIDGTVHPLSAGTGLLARAAGVEVVEGAGERVWRLEGAGALAVRGRIDRDWREVDRIADVAAAWLDADWRVLTG